MALKTKIVLNLTFNFKLNQKPNNIFIALFIDLLPLLSVTLSLRYTFIDYRFHFSTQKKDHHRNSKFYYIIPGCASNISSAVAFQKRYDASMVVPQPLNDGFWHCFDFYPTPKCDIVDVEHHCSSSLDDIPTFSPMISLLNSTPHFHHSK